MTEICIAEDDRTLSALYKEVLETVETFHVLAITESAEELLELLKEMKHNGLDIDIILLDQRLRGRTGIGIIPDIRKIYVDVKIIIVSGDSSIARRSIEAGADSFLLKPFRIEELVGAIRSATGESGRNP